MTDYVTYPHTSMTTNIVNFGTWQVIEYTIFTFKANSGSIIFIEWNSHIGIVIVEVRIRTIEYIIQYLKQQLIFLVCVTLQQVGDIEHEQRIVHINCVSQVMKVKTIS